MCAHPQLGVGPTAGSGGADLGLPDGAPGRPATWPALLPVASHGAAPRHGSGHARRRRSCSTPQLTRADGGSGPWHAEEALLRPHGELELKMLSPSRSRRSSTSPWPPRCLAPSTSSRSPRRRPTPSQHPRPSARASSSPWSATSRRRLGSPTARKAWRLRKLKSLARRRPRLSMEGLEAKLRR